MRESEFGGLDWTTGLEYWTGLLQWIVGMDLLIVENNAAYKNIVGQYNIIS